MVAILTGLGLVEGHLRSGTEAEAEGDAAMAHLHGAHPTEEIQESLDPLL